MIFYEHDDQEIATRLLAGEVGVLRTDTLYGLVCRADNQAAVERIYRAKGRDGNKSPIVLIASQRQLFDGPSEAMMQLLSTVWPGKISVIIPSDNAPSWIERRNNSVAYRLPANAWLQRLLAQTGPLIAPSANPQGRQPAQTVRRAVDYFGDAIDFYVDGGEVTDDTPSQLLRMDAAGLVERLR
jgi:L-threonylcarbamoyladenylate synthase